MPHRVLRTDHSSGCATSIQVHSPGARRVDSPGCATSIQVRFDMPHRVPVESDSPGCATSIQVHSTRHAGSVQPPMTKASGSRPTIDSDGSPCPGGSGCGVRIGRFEVTTTALEKAILNSLRIQSAFTTPPLRLATSILGRCFRKPPPAEMVFPGAKKASLPLR